MAEQTSQKSSNDQHSSNMGDAYCPHNGRDGCVIHFKCCEEGAFFPCHKCHNEAIEKENELALEEKPCNSPPSPNSVLTGETLQDGQQDLEGASGESGRQSQVSIQKMTVKAALIKHEALMHPKAKGRDGDKLKCTKCNTEQKISNLCEKCQLSFAEYYCQECHILVSKDRGPYHCSGCGVCRCGGEENFFHCDKCNICLDKRLQNNHKCRENCREDLCGICFEELFSGSLILPCSHRIHRECAEKLVTSGRPNCPLCRYPIFQEKAKDEEITGLQTQPEASQFTFQNIVSNCFSKVWSKLFCNSRQGQEMQIIGDGSSV